MSKAGLSCRRNTLLLSGGKIRGHDGSSSKHAHDDVNVIMSMACNVKQSLRLMRNSAEQYFLLALRLHSIKDHVKKNLYANGEKYRDGFLKDR